MKKILIINSNYYKNISKNLVFAAAKILTHGKLNISVINVPGIFEIPISVRKNIKKFDGFVALGCVIKGETPHFDLICSSTFDAILKLSISFNKPIGNGIITSLNMRQAIARSQKNYSKKPNKGSEAAKAVLSILKNESKKF
jgi:6,7-dimethyl-8-ribityllumazine synthase